MFLSHFCVHKCADIDRSIYLSNLSFCKLLDVQAGLRKGRETRDQIGQHPLDHRKSKRVPEKLLLLY